ncbi:O-acyltransferase like protein-like [Branchiostoma lanceolatum]|uniref:O-acyltransferase like protein-like n=1 Tax=Branchiostoma lanceolatum TaxID=7740 RepID=UPI0034538D7E
MAGLLPVCLLLMVLGSGCAQQPGDQTSDFQRLIDKMKISLHTGLDVLTNLKDENRDAGELPDLSEGNVSEQCRRDIFKFWQDLRRGKTYALLMLDSFGKPPSGILTGNYNWLGRYSECNKITGEEHNITFNGKYYIATLTSGQMTPGITLKLGVCAPSSCSTDDVIQQLKSSTVLGDFVKQGVVHVTARFVSTQPIKAGTVAAICICGSLFTLILLGTMYDVMIDRPKKAAINGGKVC